MKRNPNVILHQGHFKLSDVAGKRIAIIGGTGGIGRALSKHLTSLGANVIVVGQTFRDAGTPNLEFLKADLSLMREAQRVATELPAEALDIVIFTTGIFAAPKRQETTEGIERDMAVSYLSRFVILRAIAPRLGTQRVNATFKPRMFVMGFPGSGQLGSIEDFNAEKSYKALSVHMNTVAGNEILVLDASKRYPEIAFFGLNPGILKTNIRDNFLGKNSLKSRLIEAIIGWVTPSADSYAKRITPLLFSSYIHNFSGAMFNNKGEAILPSEGLNSMHINKFIAASESLLSKVKN